MLGPPLTKIKRATRAVALSMTPVPLVEVDYCVVPVTRKVQNCDPPWVIR
jgi:hypothetical protein